jgi:uncharacterized membrane protein YhhN
LYHLIPVPFALVGIAIYWSARQSGDIGTVAIVQPAITILCIATALLSLTRKPVNRRLTAVVSAGLAIALVGDFLNLDMTDPGVVIRALVIAIVAYLTYAIGLTVINGFHRQDRFVGLAALAVYGVVMSLLWPHLGDMRIPGLVYGLVLPFLVTRAVSTFFGDALSRAQAILLTAGASMLYLGDIEFALHTYLASVPMLFGPVLYSGGQLLIALSASYAGAGKPGPSAAGEA